MCEVVVAKISSQTLKNFTEVATLAAFGGFFIIIKPGAEWLDFLKYYNQIKENGNILMGMFSNLQLIFRYFFEKIKI